MKSLQKLCLAGVISTELYWQLKKLRSTRKKQANRRCTYERIPFSLSKFSEEECLLMFRFTKHEIRRLVIRLHIQPIHFLEDRTKVTGLEALCILLRRLSYPNRLNDLVKTFNRDPGTLSKICNWAMTYIFEKHRNKLQKLTQTWLSNNTLQTFAMACFEAGSYYENIVGFIDGTGRGICRPKYSQRLQYSGYKKQHLVKYQSIVYPNGLIGRLDGPFNGHRHDSAILNLSNLKAEFRKRFVIQHRTFAVYGDPGYSNQKFIKIKSKSVTKTERV